MWTKWLPWRMVVQRLAKRHGFMDPLTLMEQLKGFAQPSEVSIPVEIARLGSILHARGLMNSQAIQHNLDWVWPYWVERQFDPHDISFIPRAFSVSHINLTHRNWTAVGIPGCDFYPIVDPAGLVTPLFDSWSVDSWVMEDASQAALIPSRFPSVDQKLLLDEGLAVVTESATDAFYLSSRVEVEDDPVFPKCVIHATFKSERKGWGIISLRPCNPEGVSFIHEISLLNDRHGWRVNDKSFVYLSVPPERFLFSDYRGGDVHRLLPRAGNSKKIVCEVGMATAAAAYALEPGESREVVIEIPLPGRDPKHFRAYEQRSSKEIWDQNMQDICRLTVPEKKFQFLYEAALKTMLLHAPKEVYPGPYTYKHFWFRDAAFILNAMLCAGFLERVEQVIDSCFFSRQNAFGYFYSQDGEWDSNGQALWTLLQFCRLAGRKPKPEWKKPVERGAAWIEKKRLSKSLSDPHAGLFPPGFSAEHLGPNDYYYWDDFWGAAGLAAASELALLRGDKDASIRLSEASADFLESISKSLKTAEERLGNSAMPASPYRRMDSGAIGSLAAGYPLQLWDAKDPRLTETVNYLIRECSFGEGFFHDMSHSGINPYLTLHLAQNLLRAGDSRYYELMQAIADLASPTGQWPEAIHPKTRGGCMGDGQHVWAAAEWVLMIRNCFVREEKGRLILFSGIPEAWLKSGEEISFGPAPTPFGPVHLSASAEAEKITLRWSGKWFAAPPEIEIRLGGSVIPVQAGMSEVEMMRSRFSEAVQVKH